jgi:hypothetical protein
LSNRQGAKNAKIFPWRSEKLLGDLCDLGGSKKLHSIGRLSTFEKRQNFDGTGNELKTKNGSSLFYDKIATYIATKR